MQQAEKRLQVARATGKDESPRCPCCRGETLPGERGRFCPSCRARVTTIEYRLSLPDDARDLVGVARAASTLADCVAEDVLFGEPVDALAEAVALKAAALKDAAEQLVAALRVKRGAPLPGAEHRKATDQ